MTALGDTKLLVYMPQLRFGTPHDFMYFINKCHENNIGVIMDFVLSHFPKDEFGLIEFDGTCLFEYSDPFKQEHKGWGTRVFDYGKNQVRSFLISAVMLWLEYYHIDGMRLTLWRLCSILTMTENKANGCPTAGLKSQFSYLFLEALTKAVLSKYPDIIMIAKNLAFPMVTMPRLEA